MAKSVDDRGRGARLERRDEGAYCWYVTEEQRSQPGCIGREGDRLSHSRALSQSWHDQSAGSLEGFGIERAPFGCEPGLGPALGVSRPGLDLGRVVSRMIRRVMPGSGITS